MRTAAVLLFTLALLTTSAPAAQSPLRSHPADSPEVQLQSSQTAHTRWTFALADADADAESVQNYRGLGSVTTDPVFFRAGVYHILYTSKGKGFFTLSLRSANGQEEKIVHRIGFGPGTYDFALDEDQDIVFVIKSHGSWTIDVRRQP